MRIPIVSSQYLARRAAARPVRAHLSRVCAASTLLVGGMLSTVFAAQPTPSDARANYEQQRAKCISGQTNEDRATCLREAGAALEEAKRGNLNNQGNYRANSKDRCDVFTGDERLACIARSGSKGVVSGTPERGGVLRESVTREVIVGPVVQVPASAASAP